MFNIGPGEIILVLIVALLILGPKQLPELARGVGKFLREFRRQTDGVRSMVEREFYKMDQEIATPLLPEGAVDHAPLSPPAENAAEHPVQNAAPGGELAVGGAPAAEVPSIGEPPAGVLPSAAIAAAPDAMPAYGSGDEPHEGEIPVAHPPEAHSAAPVRRDDAVAPTSSPPEKV